MKNCVIIVNGYYTNSAIEHQVSSIIREFDALGVSASVVKSNTPVCSIEGQDCVCNLKTDFAVFLDKDVHLARMLEKCGVRLFNSASAVEVCDDKAITYVALCGKGVRMPVTITSPLMYRDVCGDDFVDIIEEKITYPVVVKRSFGSMGNGVFLAKNRSELSALREKLKLEPHLYQQFIGRGGVDKRVILIGGEIVACMQRENATDFRSNIEHGGSGRITQLTDEESKMATTVASALGLDYCGVDILQGDDGAYFCEANSNAFFKGIEGVTGVNVARLYAEYIYHKIYE